MPYSWFFATSKSIINWVIYIHLYICTKVCVYIYTYKNNYKLLAAQCFWYDIEIKAGKSPVRVFISFPLRRYKYEKKQEEELTICYVLSSTNTSLVIVRFIYIIVGTCSRELWLLPHYNKAFHLLSYLQKISLIISLHFHCV